VGRSELASWSSGWLDRFRRTARDPLVPARRHGCDGTWRARRAWSPVLLWSGQRGWPSRSAAWAFRPT